METHPVEQKGGLASRCTQSHVAGHGQDGAGTGANTIDSRHDGLRTDAHHLDQFPRHAGEHEQLGRLERNQRANDFVHITARAKITAIALQHHRTHIVGPFELMEEVAQLGIGLEGQRIFPIGPIKRDSGHAVFDLPQKMAGRVASHRPAIACKQARIYSHEELLAPWAAFSRWKPASSWTLAEAYCCGQLTRV
jgi:hypothetical protein